MGTPTPVFLLRNVSILSLSPTAAGTHTRLTLDIGGKTFGAMYFGMHSEKIPQPENGMIDCIFNLSFNEFAGKKSIQLIIKDCCMSGDGEDEYESAAELAEDIAADRIYPEKRYIPNRADIGALYRHFKLIATDTPFEVNTLNVSRTLGFPTVKTLLSYAVLSELDLISSKVSSRYSYEITVFSGKEKTQLDKSPLYLRLTSYGEQ